MTPVRHILVAALLAGAACCADGLPADEGQIRERVAQLDADEFALREAAKVALLKIGEAAVPQLAEAAKGDSAEQRARAISVLSAIRARAITQGFKELGQRADADVDVELGMCLIAQMLDPEVTPKMIAAKLDEMADAVREVIGAGVEPKSLPGNDLMAALTGVLGEKYGLHGDTENYNHPDNSSIHRVLEQKDGLPILLSEIAVAVARRLDVPVVGIPVPGKYMIKYDGARAPRGKPRADVIVDPYGGWKVIGVQELNLTIPSFHPEQDLQAGAPRATLARMLNNLEADFGAVGEEARAAQVRRLGALLGP